MVTKSIDDIVPNRVISLDQERFSKWNPYVFNYQIATAKITHIEIISLLNGFCVFPEAFKERLSRIRPESQASLPCSNRNSFAYMDGATTSTPVFLRNKCMRRIGSKVVDGLNPSSFERCWRQGSHLLVQHGIRHAITEINFIKRIGN